MSASDFTLSMIFVFERSFAVGFCPSIQMYSAVIFAKGREPPSGGMRKDSRSQCHSEPRRRRGIPFDEAPLALEKYVRGDGAADLLADGRRILRRGVGKDDHELVAAVARHRGGVAFHDALEEESHFAQHLASSQMAMAVVDDLEVIEVH